MSDSGPRALFTDLGASGDGSRVRAGELCRGPWSPDACHGGPVAALVARAAELVLAADNPAPFVPVRLTLDIERPVPVDELVVRGEVVRPGRKVRVVEVTVTGPGGNRLARASAVAIRASELDLARIEGPADQVPPGPEAARDVAIWDPMPVTAYHKDAVEHRFVAGGFLELGPATDWIRLAVPVMAGEDPSPWQRVAAAADFTNGISGALSFDDWTFINPDLTVTLHRLPSGPWIGVDAVTRVESTGVATAEADLYDAEGRLGRSVQTLIVQPR